jgi:O-antigen ligase
MIFLYWLIWILPMPDHPLWSHTIGGLTIIKWVGALCVLAALVSLVTRPHVTVFFSDWSARWFLLYFLVEMISYLYHGGRVTLSPSTFANLTSILMLFMVTLVMVNSVARLRWVVLMSIGSIGFSSLYVISQWWTFRNVWSNFRGWGGVSGDPDYFSLLAVLWLPLATLFIVSRRPMWERLFCLGSAILTVVAIVVSASRGGFIGLVTALLFFAMHSKRRFQILAATIVLIPLLALVPGSPLTRLMHPNASDDESSDNRLALWGAGVRMFEGSPLTGIGVDQFALNLKNYPETRHLDFHVAHNTYVDIGSQMGLLGLIPFLALIYCTYRALRQVAQQTAHDESSLLHEVALGIQAGVIACAVSILFLSAWWEGMLWFVLFLTICIRKVATATSHHPELAIAMANSVTTMSAENPMVVRQRSPSGAGLPRWKTVSSDDNPFRADRTWKKS